MPRQGSNLPGFREQQLDFAAHIRNPEVNPRPGDIEARRMQIYLDLFYNNIESFLSKGFPVAKQIMGETLWPDVVREFIHRHPCESPYFLEISQEFLTYVDNAKRADLPEFMLELCHYEWVELALAVDDAEIPDVGIDRQGDLAAGRVVVSPLIWKLSYRYPVHKIGPGFQPESPPDEPTLLVVYRRRDESVRFLEANPVTFRLLDLLAEPATGAEVLRRLQGELPNLDSQVVHDQGLATMVRLREAEIILGIESSDAI
jgi:hypothetical protein